MSKRTIAFIGCVCLSAASHQPLSAQEGPTARERVERSLLTALAVEGRETSHALADRMAYYDVPGVSVAVIDDGEIAWAAGYGVKAMNGEPVDTATLFQAASISKPVAAAAALRLVEEGRLALDEDVNETLTSWRVPETSHTATRPVTLRDLLSHTAGLTVHGFPGYAAGEAVPTTVEVLDGSGMANTDPVVSDTTPGARWRYSGGGYTVAQQLIEDATGEPFEVVLERLVLGPAGMRASTYAQPLPDSLRSKAASAHRPDGSLVDGGWHTYPEQAAAGLWTTPGDLARFALAIRAAYLGRPDGILRPETARLTLTEVMGGYGLGPGVSGTSDSLYFSHGGANRGYRAFFALYAETGDGVAVMTNGDGGGGVAMEIVRAVAAEYDWPDFQQEVRSTVAVDDASLDALVGRYDVAEYPDLSIEVLRDGDHLMLRATGGVRATLYPQSATEFFALEDGLTATFEPDADGGVELRVRGVVARLR